MSRLTRLARVLDAVSVCFLNDDDGKMKDGGILKQPETSPSGEWKQVKFQDEEEASTLGTGTSSEEETRNHPSPKSKSKKKKKNHQPDLAAQHLALVALPITWGASFQNNGWLSQGQLLHIFTTM